MDLKAIVVALVGLGIAFFYLAGDNKFTLPDMGIASSMGGGGASSLSDEGGVLAESGPRLAMAQLVDGIDAASISAAPSEIRLVGAVENCAVTRPAAGQRIVPIMVEPIDLATQIYSYDDDEIARSAAYEIDRVLTRGGKVLSGLKDMDFDTRDGMALDLVNVIIPPGPEPVYLILKDQWGGILWNILPMPGATVAQVTQLGGGNSGVVNLPEGAVLEVADLASGACGAFYRVIEKPSVTEDAGFVPSDETRAAWDAYNEWFGDTFGIAADTGQNGRERAIGVLAGKAPPEGTAKAVWQGVGGKVVLMTPNDVIYAVDPKQHKEWFVAKAKAEITKAFGVPEGSDIVALLKPIVHERTN
jgi:hypothetical protein